MVNIYTDGFVSLDTDKDKLIFRIVDEKTVYDEKGFTESLEYIRQTWKHAVINNIKLYIYYRCIIGDKCRFTFTSIHKTY